MNIRYVASVFSLLILAGCATKSGFESYVSQENAKKTDPISYQVTDVSLTLSGDAANERYLDQSALQEAFKKALTEQIESRQLTGNSHALSVSVKWKRTMWRVMAGAAPSDNVFSSASCLIESKILHDGKVIAIDQGDPLNAGSILYSHKNMLNNLKRIGNNLSGTGSPDSEQRELQRCAKLLVVLHQRVLHQRVPVKETFILLS